MKSVFVDKILKKSDLGDTIYVVKPITIRWQTPSFDNTNVVCAKYTVVEQILSFWNKPEKILAAYDLPRGTKRFNKCIYNYDRFYQCFFSAEEAEIWKIMELQQFETMVNQHIEIIKTHANKKIKKIKQQKFNERIEKFPETVLKIM